MGLEVHNDLVSDSDTWIACFVFDQLLSTLFLVAVGWPSASTGETKCDTQHTLITRDASDKSPEIHTQNDEFITQNDEFITQNDGLCTKHHVFAVGLLLCLIWRLHHAGPQVSILKPYTRNKVTLQERLEYRGFGVREYGAIAAAQKEHFRKLRDRALFEVEQVRCAACSLRLSSPCSLLLDDGQLGC